jgi:hypothetical protein
MPPRVPGLFLSLVHPHGSTFKKTNPLYTAPTSNFGFADSKRIWNFKRPDRQLRLAPGITMWICNGCNKNADFSLITSYGPCEICGKKHLCMDIQTANKKPIDNPNPPLTVSEIRGLSRSEAFLINKKGKKKLKKR